MVNALYDQNIPILKEDDKNLFISLIDDLFPKIKLTTEIDENLKIALDKSFSLLNL